MSVWIYHLSPRAWWAKRPEPALIPDDRLTHPVLYKCMGTPRVNCDNGGREPHSAS
jgi:hypothetical protein